MAVGNKNEAMENEPVPIHFKSEDVIFPNSKESEYRIIFPFDDKDVTSIYLLNQNFKQSKNRIVEELKKITGRDYSSIIKHIELDDDKIVSYKPQPIVID